MLGNIRINHLGADRPEPFEGPLLVGFDHARAPATSAAMIAGSRDSYFEAEKR
jgi:hypothetical protein